MRARDTCALPTEACCVAGEENSRVQAHMDENEFSAHILTDGGEYNVEVRPHTRTPTRARCRNADLERPPLLQPLWRFTSAPPDGRLLVYRSDAVRSLRTRPRRPPVCGYVTSNASSLLPDGASDGLSRSTLPGGHGGSSSNVALVRLAASGSGVRAKREVHDHAKNTCPLLLVADHRFFRHMGHGEESTTLNYLVSPGLRRHGDAAPPF